MADNNYNDWRTPGNTPVSMDTNDNISNTGILFDNGGSNMNDQACIIGADVCIEGDVYSTRPIILQGIVTGAIRTSSTVSFDGGTVQKNIITFSEDEVKAAQEQIKNRVSAIQLQNLKKELDDRDAEANYKPATKKTEVTKPETRATAAKLAATAKESTSAKTESSIIPTEE